MSIARWAGVLAATTVAAGGLVAAPTAVPAPEVAPLTNLTHLDYLLDQATPADVDGHTTYRLAQEPHLTFPWTYAEPRQDGTYERIGGGPLDPETGHYSQGAYNADDVSRAAVVYLRHWQQTGAEASRHNAYELLRSLAYLQTSSGPDAGNVVLWIQADGTLNPSAEPVELPDPSDSGPSYWLARTIWAFGEGYAAFQDDDPHFAGFLRERLELAVGAVDRQVLGTYGEFDQADGEPVPSWLIVDGADASAEAVLGLAAYIAAEPDDEDALEVLARLSEGIAAMGAGDARAWPYGAILPWAQSRSIWHAWASQMPAALAEASTALGEPDLLKPAIADSAVFTPTLLTAGGPDNGWLPTPSERVQIAYGVDSRLQSLLAVAEAAGQDGFAELAAIVASWYFGANPAGEPMYDPATGRTFDGVQVSGEINRNSGAESTIHGLLSMLALDAHPEVRAHATALTTVTDRQGLRVVEAEDAAETTGTVATPDSPWTGESLWSGDQLRLSPGDTARFMVGASPYRQLVEPVSWLDLSDTPAHSFWQAGPRRLGTLEHVVGEQGITAVPGALLPSPLRHTLPAGQEAVTVRVSENELVLDSLIVRPEVSWLTLSGDGMSTQLLHSASRATTRVPAGHSDAVTSVHSYDASGRLIQEATTAGVLMVNLRPGGFAVVMTTS